MNTTFKNAMRVVRAYWTLSAWWERALMLAHAVANAVVVARLWFRSWPWTYDAVAVNLAVSAFAVFVWLFVTVVGLGASRRPLSGEKGR